MNHIDLAPHVTREEAPSRLFSHLVQESNGRSVSNTDVLPAPRQEFSISPGCDAARQKPLGDERVAPIFSAGGRIAAVDYPVDAPITE